MGMGAMTGRGMGRCNPNANTITERNQGKLGLGGGRGRGCGAGIGRGRGFAYVNPQTPVDEQTLKEQKALLEQELQNINSRLTDQEA